MASSTAVVASVGAPLVPRIAAEQGVSLAGAQWILTVTFLSGAVTTPLLGRLGSGPGRRPVVLGGLAAVLVGCVLAAVPLGFGPMVAGRALQGLGLAVTPLAIAVARDVVPASRRPAVIAGLSVTTVAGAGLGYPIASLVVDRYGVSAAYWTGAVITAVTLACVAVVLPTGTRAQPGRTDVPGAILLAAGSGGLLLALSRANAWGPTSAVTLGVLAGSVLALVAWTRWTLGFERRPDRQPLVDLRLALRPGVVGPNATALVAGCGMYMLITLVVLAVQAPVSSGYGLGHDVTVAGVMLLPFSVASVLGSRLAGRRTGAASGDALLAVGCALFALGALVLAAVHDHLWGNVLAMSVGGLGSGCSFAAMPSLMMRFVPPSETGSAMAFNQILRYLGFSAGSALVVTILDVASDGGGTVTSSGFVTAAMAAVLVASVAAVVAVWSGRAVPSPAEALLSHPHPKEHSLVPTPHHPGPRADRRRRRVRRTGPGPRRLWRRQQWIRSLRRP
ncbi:MFS transporter [Nocardioides albidus]|nr:MFS transporter [Nocardioides albidus]